MSNQHPVVFELCAQTISDCLSANAGGAHRIELCSSIEVGGLTPRPSLVRLAVQQSSTPVHVLLRPFADDFRSSPQVIRAIKSSLQAARRGGAAGFVLGLLQHDGTVDIDQVRSLVQLAAPLPVTFHRAFDATPDLFQALEDVILTGCKRVLTSGGAPDVHTGAPTLARLIQQAGARIDIAAGGGLRLQNASAVAGITGGKHFHGTLKRQGLGIRDDTMPTPEKVRQMIHLLSVGADTRAATS